MVVISSRAPASPPVPLHPPPPPLLRRTNSNQDLFISNSTDLFARFVCALGMSSLCYPYGAGITCVCDEGGRIYKCFPEIKAEGGGGGGGRGGALVQAQGVQGRGEGGEQDTMDRRSGKANFTVAGFFLLANYVFLNI